jgi:hypothetical protein
MARRGAQRCRPGIRLPETTKSRGWSLRGCNSRRRHANLNLGNSAGESVASLTSPLLFPSPKGKSAPPKMLCVVNCLTAHNATCASQRDGARFSRGACESFLSSDSPPLAQTAPSRVQRTRRSHLEICAETVEYSDRGTRWRMWKADAVQRRSQRKDRGERRADLVVQRSVSPHERNLAARM